MRAFVLVVLLGLLVVPVVGADHVFSHRIVVVGRVIDSEGSAAPGYAVSVSFENVTVGGPCIDSKAEATGPLGDFEVCRHAHVIGRNVSARVTVGAASAVVPVDVALRRGEAFLQIPEPSTNHDFDGAVRFNETLRVDGRIFRELTQPEKAEGVEVLALPLQGEDVVVELYAADLQMELSTTTDEMGDYSVEFEVGALPPDASVIVRAGGIEFGKPAPSTFRRVDVSLLRGAPMGFDPDVERPGTRTPELPLPAWVSVVALAGAAAYWRRR